MLLSHYAFSFVRISLIRNPESSIRNGKEVPMIRLFNRTEKLKTVVYGIAVTVAWLLTTVYYILSASH